MSLQRGNMPKLTNLLSDRQLKNWMIKGDTVAKSASPCIQLQSAMVLELVDAALQVVEAIPERTAAWQAFARNAVHQQGLVSFARLAALLKQYEPSEDEELAILLWQGAVSQPEAARKAVRLLRGLTTFLQGQGISNAACWLQWREAVQVQSIAQEAREEPVETVRAVLWHLDHGRCDVPWVLKFARRVLGQAPAHGHLMLAVQEMAEAMGLSARALARRIAWHERQFQALDDAPPLRLYWWQGVKRTLKAQLHNATTVTLAQLDHHSATASRLGHRFRAGLGSARGGHAVSAVATRDCQALESGTVAAACV